MENLVYTVICSDTNKDGHNGTGVCGVSRSYEGAVNLARKQMTLCFKQLLTQGVSVGKVENIDNQMRGACSIEDSVGNIWRWYIVSFPLAD